MSTEFIAKTAGRVQRNTADRVNREIEQQTLGRLDRIGLDPEKIKARLQELDAEWDIERAIEANASILMLTTLMLGTTVNRKWLWMSGLISGFLLQHAIQGWCPPVPILRRLGFRTPREIDDERSVLLSRLGPDTSHEYALEAAIDMVKH